MSGLVDHKKISSNISPINHVLGRFRGYSLILNDIEWSTTGSEDMNAWVLIAKISWGPIGPSRTNHGQMLGWWRGNHRSNFSMPDFPLQELYSNYCPYNCLILFVYPGLIQFPNPEKWRVSTCLNPSNKWFHLRWCSRVEKVDNPGRWPWVPTPWTLLT